LRNIVPRAVKSDTQWGLRRARKSGLRIVEPRPNELQLDIDSIGLLTFHQMQWDILEKAGITKGWKKTIRKSKRGGEHVHITIQMDQFWAQRTIQVPSHGDTFDRFRAEQITRVLLQVILGSDPRREAFNLCRVLNGNKYPIVFFENVE